MTNKEAIERLQRQIQWVESDNGKHQMGEKYYEVLQPALQKAVEVLRMHDQELGACVPTEAK